MCALVDRNTGLMCVTVHFVGVETVPWYTDSASLPGSSGNTAPCLSCPRLTEGHSLLLLFHIWVLIATCGLGSSTRYTTLPIVGPGNMLQTGWMQQRQAATRNTLIP